MAQKAVAVEGDVQPTGGTVPFSPAVSGTWTPRAIQHSSYAKLTVGGTKTIWKAECTFDFTGPDSNGVTVTGSSPVTLTATPKKLQGGGTHVLVHGDEASDSYGNKLKVNAAGKLRSA